MARSDTRGDEAARNTSEPRDGSAKVARLRDHIDSGKGADKVAARDPAAAPLGTDAEAAGHPPTAAEADRALHAERARDSETHPQSGSGTKSGSRSGMALGLGVAVVLLLGLLAWSFAT
jgi:hypothetical protein